MIGQRKLLNRLNNITLDELPRSLILLGDYGCGKHTYAQLIANKLNLSLIDITDNITLDNINDIYSKVAPNIYIIDSLKVSVKEQNMLLKFVEEPLKNSYIIILCESKYSLLPTILNRCHIWEFESYSKEELNSFGIEDLYNIADTPGQLLRLNGINVSNIIKLVDSIIDRMGAASISNALSIPNKIAFKGEKDRIDLYWFNRILLIRFTDRLKANSNQVIFEMYKLVSKYIKDNKTPRIDAKSLLDNLIVNLWEVAHNYGITTV